MRRFLAAAVVTLSAAASGPAAAQTPDEDMPSMGDLISAAFPKWTDDTDGRVQTIAESKLTQRWTGDTPSKAKQRKVIVEPTMVLRAAPGRYVLLATMQPAYDDGTAQWAHGTPAGLAAYTFTTSANGWKLLKRQEPFDLRGYEGAAHLEPVQLSATVQGVVAEYGSCWQGYCGRWISVYELGKDGVKPAAIANLALSADNVYARPDCVERLKSHLPRLTPGDPAGANDPVPPGRCFKIEGRWSIEVSDNAPGAFVVSFGGADSGKDGGAASRIEQSLRYQWRGARYERSSGSNPVPSL
jgi:hypothetical protein